MSTTSGSTPNDRKTKSYTRAMIRDISRGVVQDNLQRLVDLAVEKKFITKSQAEDCLKDAASRRTGLLGGYLIDKKWLKEAQLQQLYDLLNPAADGEPEVTTTPPLPSPPGTPPAPYQPKGRYELVDKIGDGPCGEVHRANDREMKRPVAMKFLKEAADSREGGRAKFFEEAKEAANFTHPMFAEQMDVRENWGRPYLVMEFVEGLPLAALLRERPPGDPGLVEVVHQVAGAMGDAHEAGIIHRDLKPANVIVTPDGTPKITDVRLVQILGVDRVMIRMGAPACLAPEQISGKMSEIGPRTDVYALGAMLHQVLTGKPVFEGKGPAEITTKALRDDAVPARQLNPAVHADLETIALKALEKDPQRRYANALEFADDLRRHLSGRPIQAIPPDLTAKTARWVKKNRFPLATVISLSAAGVLLAGAAAWWLATRTGDILARAEGLEKGGQLAEARDEYARIAPSNPEAKKSLDRVIAEIARREAEAAAKAALAARENSPSVQVEEARALLDEALAHLRGGEPNSTELADLCGQVRTKSEKIAARWPKLPEAQLLMGLSWELEGWEKIAEGCWKKAYTLDAQFAPARIATARSIASRMLLEELADPDATRSGQAARDAVFQLELAGAAGAKGEQRFAEALSDLLEGKADSARDRFKAMAAEKPDAAGREELLWWHAMTSTSGVERLAILDRAIKLRPGYALALYARGAIRESKGDIDGAMQDLAKAVSIHPRLAVALARRSACHRAKKDFRKAIADASAAIELDPALSVAYVQRGLARQADGNASGAVSDFTLAIEVSKSAVPPYALRAAARVANEDFEGAVSDADRAIGLKPSSIAYASRAKACLKLLKLKPAETDLVKAIEIAPFGWPELDATKKLLEDVRKQLKKK